MYGLTSTLSTAAEALNAESGAIAVTNNNIANVNTEGYARQVVSLSAAALSNGGVLGNDGVSFGGYSSVRDEILQLSINQKTSDVASLNAQSTSLTQIESAFSQSDAGLGSAFSSFFSAVSGLSTSPQDGASQQSALSAAGQVVNQFHQAAATLSSAQSSADQTIAGTVAEINQLSTQIAGLDQQLAPTLSAGQDGGALQDQRDALTTKLALLTGITSIRTNATPTLTLSNGTPLVMNGVASPLQVSQVTNGTSRILDAAGNDITDEVSGGSLGGALTMRDQTIPGLSSSLNQLALQFADAVNAAQGKGYDTTGAAGQPIFSLPTNGSGAAVGIGLSLSTASGIAMSSNGAVGDTGNLQNLLAIQTQPLASGQTPSNTFAAFVQNLGLASAQASSSLSATTTSLDQLTSLQSSESGVSVDEETTNLIRYQQAYSAAAQVISTINNLFSVVLNMSMVN